MSLACKHEFERQYTSITHYTCRKSSVLCSSLLMKVCSSCCLPPDPVTITPSSFLTISLSLVTFQLSEFQSMPCTQKRFKTRESSTDKGSLIISLGENCARTVWTPSNSSSFSVSNLPITNLIQFIDFNMHCPLNCDKDIVHRNLEK